MNDSIITEDNNVIAIKQKLKESINIKFYDYIKKKLNKNVKDCNLLYTQVCYLIKLFILYEYEQDINIDYDFNELFIRFCFKLIKNGNTYILSETEKKDDIKNRLVVFYNDFNTKNIPFKCPENVDSISHITNALSRDITTNITNNIVINFYKYIKEYIKISLKNNNFDISSIIINSVFNDIIYNTFNSDSIFHEWIKKNRKLIIPSFKNETIQINCLQNDISKYNNILKNFIMKYIKNNELILTIFNKNNIDNPKKIKTFHTDIYNDIINNTFKSNIIFHDWIKENISLIINNFNSSNYIDIETKLISEPFIFIKNMIFMNKYLELNKSKKKYQIIPLRTNMTPKFIPINTHALVDILDSNYLDNIKNYYHNNTSMGIDIWNKFFVFTTDFIKKTIKKKYIFSGSIQTNGYEIIFNFYSKKYSDNKNNFHSSGKQAIKNIKELTKNLSEEEKQIFEIEYEKNKEELKNKKKELNRENIKKKKEIEKEKELEKLKYIEIELTKLNKDYDEECNNLKNDYLNGLKKINNITLENSKDETDKYKSKLAYLTHCYQRDKETLINDYQNNIDEKYQKIVIEDDNIKKNIEKINKKLKFKKRILKKLKSKRFKEIKSNEEIIKYIKIHQDNIQNNKKNNKTNIKRNKLINIINKVKKQRTLLNYECKELTNSHIKIIKKNILNEIKNINNLDNLENLENLNNLDNLDNISIINLKELLDKILLILILDLNTEKYGKLEFKKNSIDILNDIKNSDEEYLKKYTNLYEEIKDISKELCKELLNKRINDKKFRELFKINKTEYMKIDSMSKKYLKILEKLNWTLCDPGSTSIFNILSKDGSKKYNYTKKMHNNRISLKKINKKIIKIKKEKIEKIENELCKEEIRLKTSNNYEIFKKYYNKKMSIHSELEMLYNDERLNKLKWNLFINNKRAENKIVNDIKKTFGEDVVIILGDWSMNKQGLKGMSTPNKKYTKILENNFLTLQINEFRTSIIHNKTELRCTNYIKKYNTKYENIKTVKYLEDLKIKDNDKYLKLTKDKKIHKILVCKTNEKLNEYVDRDKNSTKNMKNIVQNYINTNYRPKSFTMGTKVCRHTLMVL